MNAIFDACLRSWPWDPWLVSGLLIGIIIYFRGWRALRRRDPVRWTFARLAAFAGGLAAVFLALGSPIEPFSFFFLQVHMLQHLLLMMVAPPLLWLGSPLLPMLRGTPRPIRVVWVAPLLRMLTPAARRLTHPVVAWPIYVGVTWLWHVPRLYDLALSSDGWHYLEHVCFLGAAMLFWYPVVRPYPGRPTWSTWWLVPYLILADVQNTLLSALLTFSNRVIYSHYEQVPRLGNVSVLDDQAAAGVLMWVPGSIAFLAPLFWIGVGLLFGKAGTMKSGPAQCTPHAPREDRQVVPARTMNFGPAPRSDPHAEREEYTGRVSLTIIPRDPPADFLHLPVIGPFLRWRHARLALQIPLLLLAILVMIDGFRGPPAGPMNLAGVAPWIHWRGLLILGLLVLGNVFCMACPFLVPRTLARRLLPANWTWPRQLRNKWLAIGLIVAFLFTYEMFSLWNSPWPTAWIVLAYFTAALIVDGLFRGAAFCKYVCPIGQFNFVQSLMSPAEIRVRDRAVCDACRTKDCIRGPGGCELSLFVPRKASNMDCTLCLDCVHACPHDNIVLAPAVPGAELWRDPQRSGIGRFSRRRDLAALVTVLAVGAFVNAAMMTAPVVAWHDALAHTLRIPPLAATVVFLTLGLLVVPAALIAIAATTGWRFLYALVPIGFAMWLTHYSFHFFTSSETIVPVTQRFVAEYGVMALGTPDWSCSCCVPAATWLLRLEIVFLDVGLLASLYAAYRIAGPRWVRAIPWMAVIVALFLAGVWIVFQPMEMRGTLGG